jgi:hypothetical protein
MSSDYQSFIDYVSLIQHDDGNQTVDGQKLKSIKKKYTELYGKKIDDEDLRQTKVRNLMEELRITNDQISFEYVDLTIQHDYNKAQLYVLEKFRGPATFIDPAPSSATKETTKTPTSKEPIERQPNTVVDIICIIHKKCQRDEIDKFIETFLFKQVQPSE